MKIDFLALTQQAIFAAKAAGDIIHSRAHDRIHVRHKKTGTSNASQVVTEVDTAAEAAILRLLTPSCQRYDLALLTEERRDDGSRWEKDFFWCIDPLDGTLPFIEGRSGYAVSIALIAHDGTPMIGVIYDPSTSTLYHAIKDGGVYKNGTSWIPVYKGRHLTYVSDRPLSDTPRKAEISDHLTALARRMQLDGIKTIHGAGAVLSGIRVLEHGPAVMMKLPKPEDGGGSIWDYAALSCIFHELKLPATTYSGSRLDLNKSGTTFMNDQGIYFSHLHPVI